MRRNQNQHRQLNAEQLNAIAQGQEHRTVLEGSSKIYIAKCRVMTRILNELRGIDAEGIDVRAVALQLDAHGNAIEHTGDARGVYRLNLPITPPTAKLLFAAISVDTTLPKKRNRGHIVNAVEDEDMEVIDGDLERLNPARDMHTVCAQTYQNYKSALKWWHKHEDIEGKGKMHYAWPEAVDEQIDQQIRSYKRDVGVKKRRGIMPQKEGKSAYNIYLVQYILGANTDPIMEIFIYLMVVNRIRGTIDK